MTDCFRTPASADHPPAPVERRRLVGIAPTHAAKALRRLLSALEATFPVTFCSRAVAEAGGLDGLIVLGDDTGAADLSVLAQSCALLVLSAQSIRRAPSPPAVEFGDAAPLAFPLRGRELSQAYSPGDPNLTSLAADVVLARVGGVPVWWREGGPAWRQQSSFAAEELSESETLREHLRPGCFMGLIPLLHLLWHVCGDLQGGPRPLHASFVIDDPNLHRSSYGHVNYQQLARHAREHSYHVGLAMVPLDGWPISARAAAVLRGNQASLSLLIHGNNHTSRELGGLRTDAQATRSVGQALRRIARFEQRSGLCVDRVMAPPHGACSEAAARAMFRLGFQAACISRPYPWRDDLPPMSPADGWFPAETVAGGLPILPRYALSAPREDLIFRALLGQPLILYGHHGDLADGFDAFGDAAREVNKLGEVQWAALETIARGNYSARTDGELLVVKLHSRHVSLKVPEGISRLLGSVPVLHGEPSWDGLTCDSAFFEMRRVGAGWASESLPVTGGSQVELSYVSRMSLDPGDLRGPRVGPWPLIRRLLVEVRDRTRPLARRVSG